jgi:flavin-binding protein dodecin
MGVAKIIEITAESGKSFEDAINMGIAQASESVKDIQGAWIKEMKVVVENGKVTAYRVDMKVTFLFHE